MHLFHRLPVRLAPIATMVLICTGTGLPARADPFLAPSTAAPRAPARQAASSLNSATAAKAKEVTSAEPEVRHVVIEGNSSRIEETRVRGQVQRITVTPKGHNSTSYLILPGDGSGSESSRNSAGKRVWNVLQF